MTDGSSGPGNDDEGPIEAFLTQIVKSDRWHFWVLLASMVVSTIAGGLVIDAAREFYASRSWNWAIFAAVCLALALVAIGMIIKLERQERRVQEAEVKRVEAERDSFDAKLDAIKEQYFYEKAELLGFAGGFIGPALEHFPALVSADRGVRDGALETVEVMVLNGAATTCGPNDSGVRAVWFEPEGRTLKAKLWSGGTCKSRKRFVNQSSNLAGSTAWQTAATGEPVLWEDLSRETPDGFERSQGSKYETFITCGVLGRDDEVLGMLNVDAPQAGDLSDVDVRIVRICVRVLGAAMVLADGQGTVASTPSGEVFNGKEEREANGRDKPGQPSSVA